MMGDASVQDDGPPEEFEETLRDLAPAATLVYRVLEHEGELTQQEIATESYLPSRTVRYAIKCLEAEDLVDARRSLRDGRQQYYSVAPPAEQE